jgi:hypothetical protein
MPLTLVVHSADIGWMVSASLVGIVIGIELLVNVDHGPAR